MRDSDDDRRSMNRVKDAVIGPEKDGIVVDYGRSSDMFRGWKCPNLLAGFDVVRMDSGTGGLLHDVGGL